MPKKKKKQQKKAIELPLLLQETTSQIMMSRMASESLSPMPTKKRTLREAVREVRRNTPTSPKDRLFLALQQAATLEDTMYMGKRISKNVADQLTSQDIRDLRMVFDVFDADKSGFIDQNELTKACKILGFSIKKDDIKKMMNDVDADKSGQVDFNEFLELIISRQGDARDIYAEIMQGFRHFDRDGSGKITFENIKAAAKETGLALSDYDIKGMIYEADKDGDNEIDEEEFVTIMLKTNLFI
eukprot:gene19948-21902_t